MKNEKIIITLIILTTTCFAETTSQDYITLKTNLTNVICEYNKGPDGITHWDVKLTLIKGKPGEAGTEEITSKNENSEGIFSGLRFTISAPIDELCGLYVSCLDESYFKYVWFEKENEYSETQIIICEEHAKTYELGTEEAKGAYKSASNTFAIILVIIFYLIIAGGIEAFGKNTK